MAAQRLTEPPLGDCGNRNSFCGCGRNAAERWRSAGDGGGDGLAVLST
jgi:hypothetical protein